MKQSFAYQISALRRDFTIFCDKALEEMELSKGLMFFVLYIGKHESCSLGELALALRMDPGHTTRSIDKLVKKGFVQKERAKFDKRSQELILTKKGKEVFKKIYLLFEEWDEKILKNLEEQELEQFKCILNKIIEAQSV